MSEPGEEDRKGIQQYHQEKQIEFESLSDEDLLERIEFESGKALLEEEVRGDIKGGTTSETNWNINVLKDMAEKRGLYPDE